MIRSLLGSLFIAEELDCRVWDDPGTIGAVALKQSFEPFSSPDIFQALNGAIVFYVMWILNLHIKHNQVTSRE